LRSVGNTLNFLTWSRSLNLRLTLLSGLLNITLRFTIHLSLAIDLLTAIRLFTFNALYLLPTIPLFAFNSFTFYLL
jgi:hypothetical protein